MSDRPTPTRPFLFYFSFVDTAMNTLLRYRDPVARMLISLLFLLSGFGKITAVANTQSYMEANGVSGVLLWPAACFELGTGVLILIGWHVRPVAILLSGWCILTAAIFHTQFSDQMQMMNFLKNMTMAGGFLLIAKSGAPGSGVDGWLEKRRISRNV